MPIRHHITLNDKSRSINDLSTGGCFVSEPELGLNVGEKVVLSFKGADLTIACKGEVMRRTPGGYGIRFMSLPAVQRRDIRQMLKARFTLRYEIELPGAWVFDGKKIDGRVLNISNFGCYVQAEVAEVTEGVEGELEIEVKRQRHLLPGRIVWVNRTRIHEKPLGFGVNFKSSRRSLMRVIIERYGKGKLTR
ncbi:MAG: PilZ domain-containing protein [Planctomycetes bacterium]|nr:PilZ domain-containing protein [Planctomycetota bacterium]